MRRGFTLAELLVVIAIIAAVSAIAIPAMRGIGQSNIMASATRQLLDDLALARHKAITLRTTVYVLFVPHPEFFPRNPPNTLTEADKKLWIRLKAGSYTSYALYAERTVGDQPGQRADRYLTGWRTLPEGVFFAQSEFEIPPLWGPPYDDRKATNRPFAILHPFLNSGFPFPSEDAPPLQNIPYIAFDQNGSLLQYKAGGSTSIRDFEPVYILLAKGSVLVARDQYGGVMPYEVRESPPGNSTNNFHRIRLDVITGRAKLERLEINPRP
jgi:prepilin-type N-terminal cleavage/methylation domain-containing protein